MNKLIFTFITLFFLNNCSFNENSRIWNDKENKLETDKKIIKVFAEENIGVSEFNRDLKLDLSSIKINNKNNENQNNLGLQNYKGELTKIGNFKSRLNSETLIFSSTKTFVIFLSVSNLFSLSFQILEFSLNEQLLRKNNTMKV